MTKEKKSKNVKETFKNVGKGLLSIGALLLVLPLAPIAGILGALGVGGLQAYATFKGVDPEELLHQKVDPYYEEEDHDVVDEASDNN